MLMDGLSKSGAKVAVHPKHLVDKKDRSWCTEPTIMATSFKPDEMGQIKRPSAITALGIISFINTGLFLLLYALGALLLSAVDNVPYEEFEAQARESMGMYMDGEDLDQALEVVPVIYNSGATLMIILFLRTLMRFIGVLGIWKGRRTGFTTYAVAQVVGVFAPHIVLPWSMFNIVGMLLAFGMVGAYATQLKRLS
jgi:hypothetical protein